MSDNKNLPITFNRQTLLSMNDRLARTRMGIWLVESMSIQEQVELLEVADAIPEYFEFFRADIKRQVSAEALEVHNKTPAEKAQSEKEIAVSHCFDVDTREKFCGIRCKNDFKLTFSHLVPLSRSWLVDVYAEDETIKLAMLDFAVRLKLGSNAFRHVVSNIMKTAVIFHRNNPGKAYTIPKKDIVWLEGRGVRDAVLQQLLSFFSIKITNKPKVAYRTVVHRQGQMTIAQLKDYTVYELMSARAEELNLSDDDVIEIDLQAYTAQEEDDDNEEADAPDDEENSATNGGDGGGGATKQPLGIVFRRN